MGRRNLRDDFEAMYLRYNMVAKYIKEVDQTILQDIQFRKCVSYMTGLYFNRYKDLLVNNGFEFDDLHNIITIFGLTYWGHSKPEARDKKAFMFMMRYIGQRMQTLVRWISKKFGADEGSVFTSESFEYVSDRATYENYISQEEDQDQDESDSIRLLEETVTAKDTYTSAILERRRKSLIAQKKKLSAAKRQQRASVIQMRAEVKANSSKYKEQLCYYATSKHVSRDVRTKARLLCRQCGIDYIKWLKEKSSRFEFDSSQFTF